MVSGLNYRRPASFQHAGEYYTANFGVGGGNKWMLPVLGCPSATPCCTT